MSKTLLQLTNEVLILLREEQVTATSDNVTSALVASFVKQAAREVESAWKWLQLRQTISLDTAADTYAYVLTGAGESFKILSVFEDTTDTTLDKAYSYDWMNEQLLANNPATGVPLFYDINGTSGGDPVMNVTPIPDAAYNLYVNLVVHTEFDTDSTSTAAPWMPIVKRAYILSLQERGDDGGNDLVVLHNEYINMLADAIAIEAGTYQTEVAWYEE